MTPEEEAKVATYFATPAWREIRDLVEKIAPGCVAPIEAVVRKVRVEQWRDLQPRDASAHRAS